jgi:hypothetical protein
MGPSGGESGIDSGGVESKLDDFELGDLRIKMVVVAMEGVNCHAVTRTPRQIQTSHTQVILTAKYHSHHPNKMCESVNHLPNCLFLSSV